MSTHAIVRPTILSKPWFHLEMSDPEEVSLVRHYLRGQNMEQLGRIEDAIEEYRRAVEGGFDSPGPYDRLIHLYSERADHKKVVEIAAAATAKVRTYPEKQQWYRTVRHGAEEASRAGPRPSPRGQ